MSKFFEEEHIKDEIKNKYEEARVRLNEYLDGSTGINVGKPVSRRNLLDTFIYGELAHSNMQKKKVYDEWMRDELLSIILKNEFRLTLINVVHIISYIGDLCEEVVIVSKGI
ncbi:hypothetical protein [Marinomonas sp.]|uniref:hypothetical protein n=1 Tax=Marinomonas sp. TaxID=1904862 RepID=UPI003A91A5C3